MMPARRRNPSWEAPSVYIRTDVTSEQAVTDAVNLAIGKMGMINVAVNCAGILGAGRVLGREAPMPLDSFARTIQINLVGTFNVIKTAGAAMESNPQGPDGERGVIVNTASIAAYEGQIGQAAYSASKGGVVGMTLPIAREFARFGVRVEHHCSGDFLDPHDRRNAGSHTGITERIHSMPQSSGQTGRIC